MAGAGRPRRRPARQWSAVAGTRLPALAPLDAALPQVFPLARYAMTRAAHSGSRPAPPKIAYLTAGGGGMFCGSCMRDNTLAAALTRLGCDVVLVPLYTPIRTDEADVSVDQVFFGGINVYLQQKFPLFRYLPGFLDRWLDRPWIINRLAAGRIQVEARALGELTVSVLQGEHGHQRKEVFRLVDWLARQLRSRNWST